MARRKTYRRSSRSKYRSGGYRSSYRVSRGSRSTGRRRGGYSRGNTVRIVIEQPSANPVSRPDLIGMKPADKPKKAKF